MGIEPGWYPDRVDPGRQRFWDGERWSVDTRAAAPPPAPSGRGGPRLAVVGAAALLVAVLGVGAVVQATRDDDPGPSPTTTSEDGAVEVPTTAPEPQTTDAEVTCPVEATTPEARRVWQDEDGIHVVVVISTTCTADQVVDDDAARFGLFLDDEPLVTGVFDLSASALALPAGGSSGELSLLFDADAEIDPALRARVFLPPQEDVATASGLDLRSVVSCTQDGGGAGSGSVDSDAGARLDDAAAAVSPGSGPDPTAPPAPDATVDAAALAALEQIHRDDASDRAALRGRWVPQVSAKHLGGEATRDMFTGDVMVHTPTVFLDKLRAWEARYGDRTVLLRGSDYPSICGTQQSPECHSLWIVAVAEPRATPEEVFLDWCGREGLNTMDGVPITDSSQLNCAAYRYSDDRVTPDSFTG